MSSDTHALRLNQLLVKDKQSAPAPPGGRDNSRARHANNQLVSSNKPHQAKQTSFPKKECVNFTVTNSSYSFHLLFLSEQRGRRRRAHAQGEVPRMVVEGHRHSLRVGLLLVVAATAEIRRVDCVRSVRRTLHHAVHCREHTLHGAGPSRYG